MSIEFERLNGAMGLAVGAKWLYVPPSGEDDTDALNAAARKASGDGAVLVLAGEYQISDSIRSTSVQPRILGLGPGGFSQVAGTTLKPTSSTVVGLILGSGSGSNPGGGFVYGIGVEGPTARPTTTDPTPAFLFNGVRACDVGNLSASNFDIGYRLVGNCHGTTFKHIRAPLATCNVGVDLPQGVGVTGSDIQFLNCWLSGGVRGVSIGGQAGGYSFYGGQISAGNTGSTVVTGAEAAVMFGKDYDTGDTNAGAVVNLIGVSFEATCEGYMHRNEAGFRNINYYGCQFTATQNTAAKRLLGLAYFGTMTGSVIRFDGCFAKGTFKNTLLVTWNTAFDSSYRIEEEGWRNEAITLDADGTPVAVADNGLTTLLMSRVIDSAQTETPRGSGSFGGLTRVRYDNGFGTISSTGSPVDVISGMNGWRCHNSKAGASTLSTAGYEWIMKRPTGTYGSTGWQPLVTST